MLLVKRVEKLDKLYHIRRPLEQSHDLVLSGNHVASLLCALDCDLHVSILVKCFEDIS